MPLQFGGGFSDLLQYDIDVPLAGQAVHRAVQGLAHTLQQRIHDISGGP